MRNGIPETFDELKVYMKNFHENLESMYPPDTPEEKERKLKKLNDAKNSLQEIAKNLGKQYTDGVIDQDNFESELRRKYWNLELIVDPSHNNEFHEFYWNVEKVELEKAKEQFLLNHFGDEVRSVISDIKSAEERGVDDEKKKKGIPVHGYNIFSMLGKSKDKDREKEGRKFVKVTCPYAIGIVNGESPDLEEQTLCGFYDDTKDCKALAKYFGVEKPVNAFTIGGSGEVYRCTVSGEYFEFGGLVEAFTEIKEIGERQKILREMKAMSKSMPREVELLKRLSLNISFEKLNPKFKGLVIGLMEKNAVDWYNTLSVGDLKSIYDKK